MTESRWRHWPKPFLIALGHGSVRLKNVGQGAFASRSNAAAMFASAARCSGRTVKALAAGARASEMIVVGC